MLRKMVSRRRDGTFRLNLGEEEQAMLTALADQVDPLLDDPSADTGMRRLFPPARTDDLLAEAQWEIQQGAELRDARRAALAVVRSPDPGPLSEEALITWLQGINALRLVLAERLGIEGDDRAEEAAFRRALTVAADDDLPDEERDEARRVVVTWHVYDLLGAMTAQAVRALD